MAGKLYKIIVPVTDLWAKPAFKSSRVSQALFGEILRGEKSSKNHLCVYGIDDYRGWVRADHLAELSPNPRKYASAQIKTHLAEVYSSPDDDNLVLRLSFGTIFEYDKKYSGRLHLVDFDGWISEKDLRLRKPGKLTSAKLIASLKMFMGTPYLWGGKSSFGIDCSGLIQLVYGFHGIKLPRDSKEQIRQGRRVALKNIQPGDLIFSPGHVVVYIGSGKIIHSSLKAGGVIIESIEKSSKLYRPDIAQNINQVRRVL